MLMHTHMKKTVRNLTWDGASQKGGVGEAPHANRSNEACESRCVPTIF